MEEQIKVMITDDNEVVREGLKSIFEGHKDIIVVGQAVDGLDAIEKAEKLQPDVILMDGQMPRMDGPEAIRHIKKIMPDVKILFLTVYGDYAAMRWLPAQAGIPPRTAAGRTCWKPSGHWRKAPA